MLCLLTKWFYPYPSGLPYRHWAIIWLPQCQWSNPEKYGQIDHMNLLSRIRQMRSSTRHAIYILWDILVVYTIQLYLGHRQLTDWGRHKMAAILQTALFKCIFFNENIRILIKISLKFVPKGPVNNIPALGQKMTWRRQAIIWTNDGWIPNAYMHHLASISWRIIDLGRFICGFEIAIFNLVSLTNTYIFRFCYLDSRRSC